MRSSPSPPGAPPDPAAVPGAENTGFPPRAKIIARSTSFCNSRTFPGHEYSTNAPSASSPISGGGSPAFRATCAAKCRTSAGTSSRRSRSDGSVTGNTLSR